MWSRRYQVATRDMKGLTPPPKLKPWKAGSIARGAQSQPSRTPAPRIFESVPARITRPPRSSAYTGGFGSPRSEEHTSELQSQSNLVCRLLLEKKKKKLTVDRDDPVRLRTSTN